MILRKLWGFIIWVFERADIIPPLIIVSAWHYQGALTAHDPPPVAIALGVLIDLGHYRAVKSYLNTFQGRRLIVLVVLTAMTGYFHWLWYQNVILAAAVPLLIICLALLSKWEGWERQAHVTVAKKPVASVNASGNPLLPNGERRQYGDYAAEQVGKPPLPVVEIMAKYGVPQRTAYRWREKWQNNGGGVEHPS